MTVKYEMFATYPTEESAYGNGLKKSRFTVTLLIVYLLVGVFGETALVWCEESDSASHLKFSYTENCESAAVSYSAPYKQMMPVTQGTYTFQAAGSEKGCFDSPVSLGKAALYSSNFGFDDAVTLFTAAIEISNLVTLSPNFPIAPEHNPLSDLQGMKMLSSVVLLN